MALIFLHVIGCCDILIFYFLTFSVQIFVTLTAASTIYSQYINLNINYLIFVFLVTPFNFLTGRSGYQASAPNSDETRNRDPTATLRQP